MNKYESSRNKVTKCYKNLIWNILQETYSEFYQTSTPKFRPFTIFAKKFHLRGLTGFWYIFDCSKRTNASSPKSPDTLRKNLHLFHFEFWGMCEVFITFFMRLRTDINKYGPKYLRFIGSGDKEVIPFICNYTVKLTLTFFRVIKVSFLYVFGRGFILHVWLNSEYRFLWYNKRFNEEQDGLQWNFWVFTKIDMFKLE